MKNEAIIETKGGPKAPRKHNPTWADNTSIERQQKRREALNKIAQELGFKTWAKYETYMINTRRTNP